MDILLTLMGLVISIQSFASDLKKPMDAHLIYFKEVTSGAVPSNQAFTTRCEIHSHFYQLEIKRASETIFVQRAVARPPQLQSLLETVLTLVPTQEVAPPNIGSRIYGVRETKKSKRGFQLDLGSTIEGQSTSYLNSQEAEELITFIDHTCVE